MLKAIDEKGELRNLKTNEKGALKVFMEDGMPQDKTEKTLISNILTIGTDSTIISIAKQVTNIMIANYSDTSDITVNDGEMDYKVGSNLAMELPINKQVTELSITSSIADTKVQLVVKGVE